MITHKKFMKNLSNAVLLRSETCRDLGPESQEDIMMYAEDKN